MSIVIENLTKMYGTQKALNGVSLTIESGQITGLLGPNGEIETKNSYETIDKNNNIFSISTFRLHMYQVSVEYIKTP